MPVTGHDLWTRWFLKSVCISGWFSRRRLFLNCIWGCRNTDQPEVIVFIGWIMYIYSYSEFQTIIFFILKLYKHILLHRSFFFHYRCENAAWRWIFMDVQYATTRHKKNLYWEVWLIKLSGLQCYIRNIQESSGLRKITFLTFFNVVVLVLVLRKKIYNIAISWVLIKNGEIKADLLGSLNAPGCAVHLQRFHVE